MPNANILIVEDDVEFGEMVALAVSERFPEENIVLTEDSVEAIDFIKNNPFEIIVTDFDLGAGKPDGADVVAAAGEDTYTIIFSALHRGYDFRSRTASEPNAYVTKDDVENLFTAVEAGFKMLAEKLAAQA